MRAIILAVALSLTVAAPALAQPCPEPSSSSTVPDVSNPIAATFLEYDGLARERCKFDPAATALSLDPSTRAGDEGGAIPLPGVGAQTTAQPVRERRFRIEGGFTNVGFTISVGDESISGSIGRGGFLGASADLARLTDGAGLGVYGSADTVSDVGTFGQAGAQLRLGSYGWVVRPSLRGGILRDGAGDVFGTGGVGLSYSF